MRVAQFDCRVFQAGPLRKSALAFFAHPETSVMVDNEIILRNARRIDRVRHERHRRQTLAIDTSQCSAIRPAPW